MFICRYCNRVSVEADMGEDGVKRCEFCQSPDNCAPGFTSGVPKFPQGHEKLPAGFGLSMSHVENINNDEYLGEMTLYYPYKLDIPGTGYCHVLPCQDAVKRRIVDNKCRELLEAKANNQKIYIEVCRAGNETEASKVTDGRLVLADDGHHTFVAALRSCVPITLKLLVGEFVPVHKTWAGCVYVDNF